MAFDDQVLLAAVELKSISSSFGKNMNNRIEEALGSAADFSCAVKKGLIPFQDVPPLLGYVLIVRMCPASMTASSLNPKADFPIDPVFDNGSYFEKLTVFCHRLLADNLYQAVWIAGVDPKTETVCEPDPDLTYEKFIQALVLRLDRSNG